MMFLDPWTCRKGFSNQILPGLLTLVTLTECHFLVSASIFQIRNKGTCLLRTELEWSHQKGSGC